MRIISHRGNIEGPIPEKENCPEYINSALAQGFDVEDRSIRIEEL